MERSWPDTAEDLVAEQRRLAAMAPEPWDLEPGPLTVGGCWVCFPRGLTGTGAAGDPAWAGAVVVSGRQRLDQGTIAGVAGAPYSAGLLALREGRLLAAAVASLATAPDVLLVNATGWDHPRRAGLAIQMGAVLGIPTVGVTNRPLVALAGSMPAGGHAARSALRLDGRIVAYQLRTRAGRRPVLVHAGWRTTPEVAVEVVLSCAGRHRTPMPLREARRLAREARAGARPEARRIQYPDR